MKTLKHSSEDSQPGRGDRHGKQSYIGFFQDLMDVPRIMGPGAENDWVYLGNTAQ